MKKLALVVLVACSPALLAQSPPTAQTKAAFLKLIDKPRVDPAPMVRPMTASGAGLEQEHFSLSVDSSQRVTGLLVKARGSTGRRPVVIQLHGTGGRKEQLLPRLTTLANRGFVAVAIDGRYHGEREGNIRGLSSPYTTAIFNAYKSGREHPFFYDTVLDVMRLIDYLETRPDVDASRIAMQGISMGGWSAPRAASGEPRLKAVIMASGSLNIGQDLFDYYPPIQERVRWIIGARDLADAKRKLRDYTTEGAAQKIQAQMVIGYGSDDRIMDPQGAYRLYQAAVNSKREMMAGLGHPHHAAKAGGPRADRPQLLQDWMMKTLRADVAT